MIKSSPLMDNKKLNIAFLLGRVTNKGGISRVTSIITNELINEDYIKTIHIFSFHKKDNLNYGWNKKIKFHNLTKSQPKMLTGILPAMLKLNSLLKKENINILIATGHNVVPLALISSAFNKSKLLYWSHSSFKASTNGKFRLINERLIAKFGNGIISLTKVDEENYRIETSAKKVYQIYNPIDPKLKLEASCYNEKSNLIISVGRLTHQKNFQNLVEVANIVLKQRSNFTWHIYGSGEEYDLLMNKIKSYSLEDKLILKGHSNEIYNLYSKYSFMVMTSRYEGFPMTLIEGMSNNLPLISYDIPTGPNEIIFENKNGYLIEPFNSQLMANKIIKLIDSPNLRKSMSKSNSSLIHEFEIPVVLKKWKELFTNII